MSITHKKYYRNTQPFAKRWLVKRRSVLSSVGLVPLWVSWVSYHCVIVGPIFFFMNVLWIRNFSSWVFWGPKIFSVGISCVQNFFSWVFRGSNIFSWGYFVGIKVILVDISWIQNFYTWVFCGSKFFSHWCFVRISRTYKWGIRVNKRVPTKYSQKNPLCPRNTHEGTMVRWH